MRQIIIDKLYIFTIFILFIIIKQNRIENVHTIIFYHFCLLFRKDCLSMQQISGEKSRTLMHKRRPEWFSCLPNMAVHTLLACRILIGGQGFHS